MQNELFVVLSTVIGTGKGIGRKEEEFCGQMNDCELLKTFLVRLFTYTHLFVVVFMWRRMVG